MRSFLGYLSAYVRSLELRVQELNTERDALLDRLIRLTTGFGLREDVPNAIQEQEKALEFKKEAIKAVQFGRERPDVLLRQAEQESLKLAHMDLYKELEELDKPEKPSGEDPNISPVTRVLNAGAN